MTRLQLYFHTIRHLHLRQIAARTRLRLQRAARERAPRVNTTWRRRAHDRMGTLARPVVDLHAAPLSPTELETIRDLADAWRAGHPTYLNRTERLGWPPRWDAPGASQLWRYHLHYFDEAPILAQGDAATHGLLRELVAQWIAEVPCGARRWRDPWHPYVASLRLVNWLLAWVYAPDAFDAWPAFERSLRDHAIFLRGNLETDVGGNHLLKNLKALAFAAVFWPHWREEQAAVRRFTAELEQQVLADDVHFERSPMYHLQVLGDALDVLLLLRAVGAPAPAALTAVTGRMVSALPTFTHPDGQIALLGDSAFDMTMPPAQAMSAWADLDAEHGTGAPALRQRPLMRGATTAQAPARTPARSRPISGRLPVHADSHARTHSGIVGFDTPRLRLVADVGALCPDELPAHAQADTFTFELAVDGVRMIVDAGVDEYAPGRWRAFYRSTRAHNTLAVDGQDSSECWGSFRAARRARVEHACVRRVDGWQVLEARHDGYRRLPQPVTHERTFALHDSSLLVLRDRLTGRGTHVVERYLHLHPETEVLPGAGTRDLLLRRGTVAVRLAWSEPGAPRIVTGATNPPQGWYGERFGARRPAPVLVWTLEAALPLDTSLALLPLDDGLADATRLGVDAAGTVHRGDSVMALPPISSNC